MAVNFIKANTKRIVASDDKVAYSWEQYVDEERKRLEDLNKHPNAGKWGKYNRTEYKGKDADKKEQTELDNNSFAVLKKLSIKPENVPDIKIRKRYIDFLKNSK